MHINNILEKFKGDIRHKFRNVTRLSIYFNIFKDKRYFLINIKFASKCELI